MIIGTSLPAVDTSASLRREPDSQAKAPDGAWLREMERQQADLWFRPAPTPAPMQHGLQAPSAQATAEAAIPGTDVRRSTRGAPPSEAPPDRSPSPRAAHSPSSTGSEGQPTRADLPPREVPSVQGTARGMGATGQPAAPGGRPASGPARPGSPADPWQASSQPLAAGTQPQPSVPAGPAFAYAAQTEWDLEAGLQSIVDGARSAAPAFPAPRIKGPRVHVRIENDAAHIWLGLDAPTGDALAQAAMLLPELRRHVEALGLRLGLVTCNGTVLPQAASARPSSPHAFDDMLSVFRHPARQERP